MLARPLKGLGIHILYSPRGPLFSSLEALNKLSQGVRELGTKKRAFAWKVDPALPPEDKRWQKFVQEQRLAKVVSDSNFGGVQPKYVMDLDITPPLQDILAQMKSKTRYNIRYAARKGVKVVRSRRKQDLSVFYALLQETAARDGFAVRDLSYFESMWDYLIEAGLAQLFLAYHGELPLAGAIAFRLGRRAWYVYGASSDELRNLQASHLMQWEMIKWAKAFGCAVYDFRGVSGELDPNNPLYGLYRFKEGFGATLREYVESLTSSSTGPLPHVASSAETPSSAADMNWGSWIEVDLDALAHNFREIQAQTGAQLPCGKGCLRARCSNGGAPFGQIGAQCFAVGDVEEALTVRAHSQAPLLLLTPPLPEQVPEVIKYRLIPTVVSAELAETLAGAAAARRLRLPVHLKVDTGLGRLGVLPKDALPLAKLIAGFPSLKLAGLYTHFADGTNRARTERQLKELLQIRDLLSREGITNVIWHAANSPGFCLGPHTHLDMVRIGTLLYGQGYSGSRMKLKDTWKLYARVIAVKEIPAGSLIGYGGTYRAPENMVIGVIPVGYSHGLQLEPESTVGVQFRRALRRLARPSQDCAFLGEQPLPIVGKVGMNLTCLDLRGHKPRPVWWCASMPGEPQSAGDR